MWKPPIEESLVLVPIHQICQSNLKSIVAFANKTVKPGTFALPWWRHQMETFSALLALCAGNSPVPVNSPHKGQWREALMFSLICAWINDWVNNREAGDLRRHRSHFDVNIMIDSDWYLPHPCTGSVIQNHFSWWRHQMEAFFRGHRWIPLTKGQ